MLIRFFSHGKGGDPLGYILSEKKHPAGVQVVRGDVALTRDCLQLADIYKHKYTSGVLAWEEGEVSEEHQRLAIARFEAELLDKNKNILWVRHEEKGRTELHFVMPRVDLETGRSWTPYWYYRDKYKMNQVEAEINALGYSDPLDPARRRLTGGGSDANCKGPRKEQVAGINKAVEDALLSGKISGREDVISLLKGKGLEITRAGEDYISVKGPGMARALRLKGGVYSESYGLNEGNSGLAQDKRLINNGGLGSGAGSGFAAGGSDEATAGDSAGSGAGSGSGSAAIPAPESGLVETMADAGPRDYDYLDVSDFDSVIPKLTPRPAGLAGVGMVSNTVGQGNGERKGGDASNSKAVKPAKPATARPGGKSMKDYLTKATKKETRAEEAARVKRFDAFFAPAEKQAPAQVKAPKPAQGLEGQDVYSLPGPGR